jgi:hypothetical protein
MNFYLRPIILFLSICNGLFINYPSKSGIGLQRWHNYNQLSYIKGHTNILLRSHNKSNIHKIVFDDDLEDEYDKLFKPKYIYNLTDFDLFLLRMYIYFVLLFTIIDLK